MKIVSITATYKRKDITVDTIKLLTTQKNLVGAVVVGSCDEDFKAAEQVGAVYVQHNNAPLSNKWQAGLNKAREFDPDAVLICGSNDWLTSNWCDACIKEGLNKGIDYIGSDILYCCDARPDHTLKILKIRSLQPWGGWKIPTGAGSMISRNILDKLNWQVFPVGLDISVDSYIREKIKNVNGQAGVIGDIKDVSLCCVYSVWNSLHDWEWFMHRIDSKDYPRVTLFKDIKNPAQWLAKNYPGISIEKYKK